MQDYKIKTGGNMKYRGIIFDLDGVICSTDRYHYQAWEKIADKEGLYFDEKINDRLRGVSRMESLNIILEGAERKYSSEEKLRLTEQKNEIYKELIKQMSPKDLAETVKNTLNELRGQGIRLAVGSSSKNTKTILSRIGLNGFFDAVSDGTNITRSKPDPEVFLKAAAMLSLRPEECLVVEDAIAGIQAASAGGFDSAGIGEAAGYEKTTYAIREISELIRICGGGF